MMYQQSNYGQAPMPSVRMRPSGVDLAALLLAGIAVLSLFTMVVDVFEYLDYASELERISSSSGGPATGYTINFVLGLLFTGVLMVAFVILLIMIRSGRGPARVLAFVAVGMVIWPGITGTFYTVVYLFDASRIEWLTVVEQALNLGMAVAGVVVVLLLASRNTTTWFEQQRQAVAPAAPPYGQFPGPAAGPPPV